MITAEQIEKIRKPGLVAIAGVSVSDILDSLDACETERDRLRAELDAAHDGEDALRSEVAKLRAQLAALQAVPQGVEVPELDPGANPHQRNIDNPGSFGWILNRAYRDGYDEARKNARLVLTPPQADAVVVPRPLSKAPTDRPILAFWQSGLGTISDVVHYFDEEGRFVCWCEMLEYEDNGGNLDFVPRDAQWIELPDALRTSAQAHNGEESNNVG